MITPKPYTQQELIVVWNKGTIVLGVNPAIKRKDVYGAWIDWVAYGNRESDVGFVFFFNPCVHILQ